MTRRVATRTGNLTLPTHSHTPERGYAASRRAYDRRRRQPVDPLTAQEIRAYKQLIRRDPCSYCMTYCGQMAADHIDGLLTGGRHEPDNLTAAGRPCNAAKKDKPLLLFLAERNHG
jgi:5-methylcytosine-specific restriction endonuclease McrA